MEIKTLGTHQAAYDAVFQHPISRNLQWREVRALLEHLSDATVVEHSGNVKFTRHGETLIVHPPQRKDFSDVTEVMRIRHFLERSTEPVTVWGGDGHHLLVVIDHREARVFRAEGHGSAPERLAPLDLDGSHRYLHAVGDDANGQRKPEPKAFYEAVATTLAGTAPILIFGSSTGASSAMDHLVAELKQHHPAIAKRIISTVHIDAGHMTDDQLLAEARKFFAATPG